MRRQFCSLASGHTLQDKNVGSKADVAGLKARSTRPQQPAGWGLLLMFALLPACLAQQRAQVSGIIADATGAILTGAQVSVVNEANGIRRDTRSNQEGGYAVGSL